MSWHQRAWKACTGRAIRNMITDLLLETNRTCSKHHGKNANDNRFTDLVEFSEHGRNNDK